MINKKERGSMFLNIGLMIILILSSVQVGFYVAKYQFKKEKNSVPSNIAETNENMPYHIPADAMTFHVSRFNDPNNDEVRVKHGIAVIPDKGIIVVKLPENVMLIVEQEGCQ